jgi:hypothetical protein
LDQISDFFIGPESDAEDDFYFPQSQADDECEDHLYGVHCKNKKGRCVPGWINEEGDDNEYPDDQFCNYSAAEILARMNSTDNLKDYYKRQRKSGKAYRKSKGAKAPKNKEDAEDAEDVEDVEDTVKTAKAKKGKKGKKPCPPGEKRNSRSGRCRKSKK